MLHVLPLVKYICHFFSFKSKFIIHNENYKYMYAWNKLEKKLSEEFCNDDIFYCGGMI